MEKISESKNAARLVNSYSTHRCSPSRAALLSGIVETAYILAIDGIYRKQTTFKEYIHSDMDLERRLSRVSIYQLVLILSWNFYQGWISLKSSIIHTVRTII